MGNIERCARDSDWCDGHLCVQRGVECPRADGETLCEEIARLRHQLQGAVEALRRIAAGHAHPSKLAGEALDALPPDDNVYDPPYIERGQ